MKTLLLIRLGVFLGLAITLSSGGCGESASPSAANSAPGGEGQAGSTARFALMANTLYAVDNVSLRTFDLSTPQTPTPGPVVNVGIGVETIFPQAPYLFIGSQQGMFIYNTVGGVPKLVGTYTHTFSCDPVVVADRYAYVTLRSDGPCARGLNQLDVVDLANLTRPQLAKSYPLSQPYGLGVDSSLVFVCDKGIKVFDARNAPTLVQVQSFSIAATDVIAHKGVLLVTGTDGLYQYRYTAATATSAATLQQLSRIPVTTKP
ncbi:hypothetical protein Q3A66_02355 [Hymenobacter sp. BT770]|uniref:hypothetical protein n=1 Tax=Hymenobacter sp. BT770 TaxID=2886942 RepID=UPI001D0F6BEB|nr:hypothetical protein [Hymenobacter sp. BT770]MCC3151529.1 hypothetical protein [Hymenobacter sp. BT770]MDO3413895.1 hypothetical protein [Hymenobacter sp. BT770]